MKNNQPNTIVFITGAFLHHSCWDQWRTYFEGKGYNTIAPPWPYKDASPEALRNSHPNAEIASNRLSPLTQYYEDLVKAIPGGAILIGHSIGGLIVQLLLQKGAGFCGIAIHPVPPQGIFTFKLSFLKAGWGALGFFTPVSKSYLMTFESWKYGFTNGMECETQKDAYYKYAVPESKLIVRDTITKAARINFNSPHAPLLITAGTQDRSIPASLNYSNYKRYRHSNSITEYKEFPGRNHFVIGQPTWKEDAAFVFDWIRKL